MKLIKRCQISTAVYWAPLRTAGVLQTDDYGQVIFKSPVQITCRKDNEHREVITVTGTNVISTSQFITEVAVEVGGMIMEGLLSKVSKPSKPREIAEAKEIVAVADTPTLKGNAILHEAFT